MTSGVDLDNWKESDIVVASGTGNAYINSIWEERPPRADERSKFVFHLPVKPPFRAARLTAGSLLFAQSHGVHPSQIHSGAVALVIVTPIPRRPILDPLTRHLGFPNRITLSNRPTTPYSLSLYLIVRL